MSDALRRRSPRARMVNGVGEGNDGIRSWDLFETVEVTRGAASSLDDDATRARADDSSTFVCVDRACYLGGSVWAMDWSPRGGWLAAEARGAAHHAHAVRDVGTCSGTGVVQIWEVCDARARMAVGMTHSGGCASDARWSPTTGFAGGRGEREDVVGALAVALGNGRVEVWMVPKPTSTEGSEMVESVAAFVGAVPKVYGAPWKLDWNAVVPGRLAAGCTSGRVVVWDIDESSLDGSPKYPKFVLAAAARGGPCRVVRWPPLEFPEDESACANIIACGSDYATRPHLFDLRAPFAPIGDGFERGQPWTLDMAWLPRGTLVASAETSDRSSAKTLRASSSAKKSATASRPLVMQFDLTANAADEAAQPTTGHPVPGRGAPWGLDARAGEDPTYAAAMVACASANGVVCVCPMRYVSKRVRTQARSEFETCGGLLAYDEDAKRTMTTNPVDPPACFEFITSSEQVPLEADLYPPFASARPGTRDSPTTAQHCVRWSKDPNLGWWLASAGEAGFMRLQKFDPKWVEGKLTQLERVHGGGGSM